MCVMWVCMYVVAHTKHMLPLYNQCVVLDISYNWHHTQPHKHIIHTEDGILRVTYIYTILHKEDKGKQTDTQIYLKYPQYNIWPRERNNNGNTQTIH